MTRSGVQGDSLRLIATLFGAGASGGMTDGQLLDRLASGDTAATEHGFSVLLERHGPMVLRICRSILREDHLAEDAFQTTFLVLIQRHGSIRRRESIADWLYGVARRVALSTRTAAARRRAHELHAGARACRRQEPATWDDTGEVLHEEIARLSGSHRAVLVLCDLEGLTEGQAAERLGWPLGTVRSRLARGRDRLRRRLLGRGLGPAGLATMGLPRETTLSATLIDSTVRAARKLAHPRATDLDPAAMVSSIRRFLAAMMIQKTGIPTACVVLLIAITASAFVGPPQTPAGASAPNDGGGEPSRPETSKDTEKPADRIARLRQARYDAVQEELRLADELVEYGTRWSAIRIEHYADISLRVLQAELGLDQAGAARIAAFRAHRDRMSRLAQLEQEQRSSDYNLAAAVARLTEAEVWLAEAELASEPTP